MLACRAAAWHSRGSLSLMNCRSFKGDASGAWSSARCHCHSVSPVILCSMLPRHSPPTDDITFRLHFKCPPQLLLLLSLPSSVLDLNIVYPLRCTTCPLLPTPPFPSLLTCVLSHLKPSPCFYPSSSPFPHLMLGDSSQQVPVPRL